jgi:RNA polymerase sigma factor (sigma-70 family)
MEHVSQSATIEMWIGRLKAGDDQARKELLNCACARLTRLARKMLKGFGRVRRWEETDDVVQNALLRLYRSLADVQPASAVDFYRLAALNIRRELLDLAKHYFGPQGLGAHYASSDSAPGQSGVIPAFEQPAADDDPKDLEAWTAFHKQVEGLPSEEKEVFDLLWYQELSQAEAAGLLNVSERTIKRRWASARLRLHQALQGQLPNF